MIEAKYCCADVHEIEFEFPYPVDLDDFPMFKTMENYRNANELNSSKVIKRLNPINICVCFFLVFFSSHELNLKEDLLYKKVQGAV